MNEKKEMLFTHVKSNVMPILVDFIESKDIPGSTILPANIDLKELNGHYDGIEFLPPKWMNDILNFNKVSVIVIDNIDSISKDEQLKFIELLKYRKISTFELPKNCVIILTAKEINSDKINKEVYSLVAHI